MINLLLDTDSYKAGHKAQLPRGQTRSQVHFLSRGGPFNNIVANIGLQGLLAELEGPIVTPMDINEAERITNAHLGPGRFDRGKWEYIWNEYGGELPIDIHALPEGTIVAPGVPMFTVENLDDECAWLPGHLETYLERVWYPITIATQSRYMRQIIFDNLATTSDGDAGADFRLHDFGGRSYTSHEAAAIGGMAHLAVGWKGTDTMAALQYTMENYACEMPAFSVPASEHSVVGAWGKGNEDAYLGHLLDTYPTGILSVVSDTYDYYAFVENLICGKYREAILARDGTVVVRPDSGEYAQILGWTFPTLWNAFGGTTNSKGYKVLNPKIRVILGDGINRETVAPILKFIAALGFSTENIVLGCGSGLIQKGIDRDTLKMAYKSNWARINGVDVDVFKDPVTDPGKKSIKGYIRSPELELVFSDGKLVRTHTLDEIRKRCAV